MSLFSDHLSLSLSPPGPLALGQEPLTSFLTVDPEAGWRLCHPHLRGQTGPVRGPVQHPPETWRSQPFPPRRFRVCKWTRAAHGEEEQAWGCLPLKTLFPQPPERVYLQESLAGPSTHSRGAREKALPGAPGMGEALLIRWKPLQTGAPSPAVEDGWSGAQLGSPRPASRHCPEKLPIRGPLLPLGCSWFQGCGLSRTPGGSAVGLFRGLALKCPQERLLDGERYGGDSGRVGRERDTEREINTQ